MDEQDFTTRLLRDQLIALEGHLNQRLDRQDSDLREIRRQTTATNGRVTKLENARSRAEGMVAAYRWVPTFMAGGLSAGLTILIMVLTGGIH